MSTMFEDPTPIGAELYGYCQNIVEELINGVGEILKDRGEALEFIRKVENFGYELAMDYVNLHRPPQAPKVGKPALYVQGSYELSWKVEGWSIYIVLYSEDSNRVPSKVIWKNPSGEMFTLCLESANTKEFRPEDWHHENKPEVLSYWPEPKEESSAIAV